MDDGKGKVMAPTMRHGYRNADSDRCRSPWVPGDACDLDETWALGVVCVVVEGEGRWLSFDVPGS